MSLKSRVKNHTIKTRQIPQRSCVACRDKKDKRDLIRLVYSSNIIEIDLHGKMPGRGAYLCSKFECWELGLRKNRLDHALRTKIATKNRQFLLEYANNLPKKEA